MQSNDQILQSFARLAHTVTGSESVDTYTRTHSTDAHIALNLTPRLGMQRQDDADLVLDDLQRSFFAIGVDHVRIANGTLSVNLPATQNSVMLLDRAQADIITRRAERYLEKTLGQSADPVKDVHASIDQVQQRIKNDTGLIAGANDRERYLDKVYDTITRLYETEQSFVESLRTALSEDDNEYDPEADEEDNPPRYPNDKEVVLHRLSVAVLGMH